MTKIAYLGIGNRLRGDDGAGSIIAEKLKNRGLVSYDGGVMPETFTGTIKKALPEILIIIDTCSMGLEPGEFAFIPISKISPDDNFTAHSMSPAKLIGYMKGFVPEIKFLGIEPGNIDLTEDLSPVVKEAINNLCEILAEEDLTLIREL